MNYRALGCTGWKVSEISFGAWGIGGDWGTVDDSESLAALHQGLDLGINLIDTADVYGGTAALGSGRVHHGPNGLALDPHV